MDNNNRLLLQSGEGAGFPSSTDAPENSLALPGSLSPLSPSSGGSWYHPQGQIRPAIPSIVLETPSFRFANFLRRFRKSRLQVNY